MQLMKEIELVKIVGGATTNYSSANWLNSLVRVLSIFLELGRNIGSAINYSKNKRVC